MERPPPLRSTTSLHRLSVVDGGRRGHGFLIKFILLAYIEQLFSLGFVSHLSCVQGWISAPGVMDGDPYSIFVGEDP